MGGLQSYPRKLPGGGGAQSLAARGNVLVVRDCQATVLVTLINNQTGGGSGERYTLALRRGEKWVHPQEFDAVEITNTSATAQNVEFLIGYGDYQQPPPGIAGADFFLGYDPVTPAIAGTLIVSANPTRKKITILADPANTLPVILAGGQFGATSGKGLPLFPGKDYPGEARGELWGASANGAQIVYVLEENFNTPVQPPYVEGPTSFAPPQPQPPPPPVGGSLTFQMTTSAISSEGPYGTTGGTSWILGYGAGANGEPSQIPTGVPGGTTAPAPPLSVNGVQLVIWGTVGMGPNWYWTVCLPGVHSQDFFASVDFERNGNGHLQLLTAAADFNTTFHEVGYTIWAWAMPATGVPPDKPTLNTDVVIAW